jgi:hypothetical protein
MKVQPTGYISLDGGPLNTWPKVGTVVELPNVVADDLIGSGCAEKVRLGKAEHISEPGETRPAPASDEERRSPRPGPKKGAAGGG